MKILVVFKTHLDIGFTDFSEQIVEKYRTEYIPDAIRVAKAIKASGRKEGFIWTTGSWLIANYLESVGPKQAAEMEDAIRNRYISWHGLPFTLHSEASGPDLFDYGLAISQKLDKSFGRHTIGAKMTDVPGHTVAIVPHLVRAGIRFLHIGINPASCPVEVPFLFNWRLDSTQITVMYESADYGGFRQIPGTDTYVYFAHTGDNRGPQSVEEIYKIYDGLHEKYPDAVVTAADLNDLAKEVSYIADKLPIVDQEIGDTWIHGIGTDPQKLSQFRALLRYSRFLPEEQRERLFSHLLLVPEHTWGLDEKTHLNENGNYRRDLFDTMRNDYAYKKMELSWAEQRRYIIQGVQALDFPYRLEAQKLLLEYQSSFPKLNSPLKEWHKLFTLEKWKIRVGENGEIIGLEVNGHIIADSSHPLFAFSYDEYSAEEVWDFDLRYLRSSFIQERLSTFKPNWATNDFGKEGLDQEVTCHTCCLPILDGVYLEQNVLYIVCRFSDNSVHQHGCLAKTVLALRAEEERLFVDFMYFGKEANRVPEALWLSFTPVNQLIAIQKLGCMINPFDVVSKGNRELHATDGIVAFSDGMSLETLDAPLLSLSGKHIYGFDNKLPEASNGMLINLYNNQWGTNFPMWTEGNRRFRFVISQE